MCGPGETEAYVISCLEVLGFAWRDEAQLVPVPVAEVVERCRERWLRHAAGFAMGWQGPGPEPAWWSAPSAVRAVPASLVEGFKVFV